MSSLSQAIRERAYLQGRQDKEIELNTKIDELNKQHLQEKEELNRQHLQDKEEWNRREMERNKKNLEDKVEITSIFLAQGFSLEASLEMARVPNEDRYAAMSMLKNRTGQ